MRAPRGQRGQAIVLVAFMLAVVVGMAALAIDGSRAYAARRDLQSAADAAALAAADSYQRTSSFISAEAAASTAFGIDLRLYSAPACAPGYGSPGASTYTVTCTYSDGTSLTDTVAARGPQGVQFQLTASRNLALQFGRILTNGTSPAIAASSISGVNNLLYAPALAALNQAGCGGAGGSAITVNGTGTLSVIGDVVSSGSINVSSGSARVAGDIYARCQSTVGGTTNACWPSGASAPCTYPDVAGAVRSGYHYVDPGYPTPSVVGGSQGMPSANVVLSPGVYAALPGFNNGGDCWFLSGGVYNWQAGYVNSSDFVSNELKPPDEPSASDNTVRSLHQFWDTNGVQCEGSFELESEFGPRDMPNGKWSFEVTSIRSDTYNGISYLRESAPSMCRQVIVNNGHGENVQLTVSNVPGATAYNIYAAPPGNNCSGPFGLAATLQVSGPVLNTNTNSCPAFNGNGCTLGHEAITLDTQLAPPFAPNAAAAPGSPGAYPPNSETAAILAGLPNQNPGRGAGAAGDRANENNCESTAGAYVSCPAAITPGAVVFYLPGFACLNTANTADTYVFSGYQYNWVSVYQSPGNSCAARLGAAGNSAYVGLVYAPSAALTVQSPNAFDEAATGGIIADSLTFTGTLPSIAFSTSYAPVPFAARLTS